MEYLFMDPPFKMKPFKDMSKKEVQVYFDWFLQQVPDRVELLKTLYSIMTGEGKERLDNSAESLVRIWKFYMDHAVIEEKSDELKRLEAEKYPEWIHDSLLSKQINMGWMAIAVDIAIYFSEVFIKEHEEIKWGFVLKPKGLFHVNKPVLVGFKHKPLNPVNLVKVLTSKLIRGSADENSLLKLYRIWEAKI